ncbi:MAG: hypothetical protein ACOC6G_01380 [Thermoproteota archaeon]
MGKTETIKDRSIYVYLPSVDMVKKWKRLADKQGTSISKFVQEHVENSLRQEKEPSYKSRGELLKELSELKEQLGEERKKARRLDLVVEKLEKELRRYQAQPFLEEDFSGVRRLQSELVEVLREGGVFSNEDLLSRLGIERSEHEAVKAVSKQLEILESYGLVQSTSRGWRWTG